MKNAIDAKTLAQRKNALTEKFEKVKMRTAAAERIVAEGTDEMAKLQAAHRELEELERTIGIDPVTTRIDPLPANRSQRREKK